MNKICYFFCVIGGMASSAYAVCNDATVFCNQTDQKIAADADHLGHAVTIGCEAGGLFHMGSCNPIPGHLASAREECDAYGGVKSITPCTVNKESISKIEKGILESSFL